MLAGASGASGVYDTVRQIAWPPGSYTREVLQEIEDMETRREKVKKKTGPRDEAQRTPAWEAKNLPIYG